MKLSPFLVSTTILFWGWQTRLWIIAIPLVIIYLAAGYINWRWDLTTADFRSCSHVCTVLLVVVLLYLLISDRSLQFIFSFFQWLPVICAPLLLAQTYSKSDRVDLHALLFFKAQKKQQQFFLLDLNFPYFALCILAAGAANIRGWYFYPVAVVLIGSILISLRSTRVSALKFLLLLLLATALGALGHIGLHRLHISLEQNTAKLFSNFSQPQTNPNQVSTAIGDIGSLKQSNKIILRLQPAPGQNAPSLIRQATYNRYASGFWGATKAEFTAVKPGQDSHSWILGNQSLSARELTISEKLNDEQGLLKFPDGSFQVAQLPVEQIEQNQYGTVQIMAESGLLSYRIQYDPQLTLDNPPTKDDLEILNLEQPAINQIINELNLKYQSPQSALNTVKEFFSTEFNYSLELAQQQTNRTPLAEFLLDHRSGHCEYFATATALLLRGIGIPTRYTVGYSVHELSNLEGQYIVRARHAHAWTQVYLDHRWQAFDTTPASWIATEDNAASHWQYFQDGRAFIGFKLAQILALSNNMGRFKYFWWLIIPVVFILIRQLTPQGSIKRFIPTRIKSQRANKVEGVRDSEIYLIEQELAKLGFNRDRSETWLDWLQRIQTTSENSAMFDELYLITKMHYRYRFDDQNFGIREREQLRLACQTWLKKYF